MKEWSYLSPRYFNPDNSVLKEYDLSSKEYIFIIVDELFTGTNPIEGIAVSYAIYEHLQKYKNFLIYINSIIPRNHQDLEKLISKLKLL